MSKEILTGHGLAHTASFVRNRYAMPHISITGICVEIPANFSMFPVATGSSVPISRGSPPYAVRSKRLCR